MHIVHLHEIDNDGRGPNTYEISRNVEWLGTVTQEIADYVVDTLEFMGEPYSWHRIIVIPVPQEA